MGEIGLLGINSARGIWWCQHVLPLLTLLPLRRWARASASVSLSYGAHSNLCVNQIKLNGTPEQLKKFLPDLVSGKHVGALAMSESGAGSDVVSMTLGAEKRNDRYILNGNKFSDN